MNISGVKKIFSRVGVLLFLISFLCLGFLPNKTIALQDKTDAGFKGEAVTTVDRYELANTPTSFIQSGLTVKVVSPVVNEISRTSITGSTNPPTYSVSNTYSLRRDYNITKGPIDAQTQKNLTSGQLSAIQAAVKDKYTITKDNVFAINTPDSTNYYIKVQNPAAKGGYDKYLIMSAVGDNLYIPEEKIKELPTSTKDDIGATDVKREDGFLNMIGAREGLQPGTLASQIRGNDATNAQIGNLTQQKEDLEKQIRSVEDEIDNLKAKQDAGTLTAQEQQRLDELEGKRSGLLSELDIVNKNKLQTTALSNSDEISIEECKGLFGWATLKCAVQAISVLANIGLKLVSYGLGLVGVMFDYSIELAVNSAEFIEKLGVVNPVWTLLRDLLNMTFIFILVWIAIQIIIDRKRYTIKKDVVRVVVVAILMNFSLFVAKVFVDGSNLATLQLYQATKSSGVVADHANISYRIMNTLGFQTIYSIGDIFANGNLTKTILGCGGANGTIISVAVFGSIFMIILSLAFLAVGLLFFVRMANIIYLFVTSPLWVWGYILDNEFFSKIRNDWWKKMKHVVKFPVTFMLFMFVAVFAFTKMFALSYGGLSFLTLFCVSDQPTIIGQLPLILNFCLVIWVILAAVKKGMEDSEGGIEKAITGKFGGWAQAASTGLARKMGDKAKQIPYAAGQVGKIAFNGAGNFKRLSEKYPTFGNLSGFKALNKLGSKIASNSNSPAWLRNMGAGLANKTKDPKFFGKTTDEWRKKRKEWWASDGEKDAARTAEVAESAKKAPKYQEKGHEQESRNQFEERVKAFAKAKARIYLDQNILNVADPTNSNKSHEEGIIENALAGIEEIKDANGNVTGHRFNEEKMRKHINNVYEAHTEKGRLKSVARHTKSRFMSKAKFEAREKAFKAATEARYKSVQTLEKLRDDLKKSEDDFKNHPETLADLETRIQNKDPKLKGVVSIAAIGSLERDIAKLQTNIAYIQHAVQTTGSHPDEDKIDKYTEEIEKKEKRLESIKKGALQNREKIQKKIEELKEKIKEQEKK